LVRVRLEDIWMSFGDQEVLRGIDLESGDGEFLTLLGPSGCGKTTLLRIIAGLYRPVRGRVFFDDEDVTHAPPWERNIGFVFQDYALWPHMKVFDNVAYGLRIRGVPREEIRRRVLEALELVGLKGLEDRYPHQLSGGQQQRVALARAIVINPSLLLLDEPLSNLDAKIRVNVRTEIRRLQKRLGITTIYVTHDQEEALVISDRIAVLNRGVVEQVDTPWRLYYEPRTAFVADFVGQVNMYRVESMSEEDGYMYVETEIGRLAVKPRALEGTENVHIVFRPEMVEIGRGRPARGVNVLEGVVDTVQFLGNLQRIDVAVGGGRVRVETHNPLRHGVFEAGERVYLSIDPELIVILGR